MCKHVKNVVMIQHQVLARSRSSNKGKGGRKLDLNEMKLWSCRWYGRL